MSRVPRIRFKGFKEDWEQRKLGVIVGIYDGVHQTPKYQDNGIMFLSVENIATLQSTKYISEDDFKRDYKVYPQENDILMTRIGDVGTTNVIADKGLKAYYVSLALLKYKSTNPYFLSNAIQSEYVKKELANRTLKTAIPMKINKDEIGKVDVMLPILVREQTKIGEYFRNLDHLITLHQRKFEKLKIIKKSMLENLFPQNGEKTPKIRFSGFTKDWEQRKLGEYLIQYTEVTIINDQYPVLTSSRKGIFFQKDYYDGNQIASENNIGYNIVPYGYFTYRHMSDDEIFYFNINNIIDNGIVSTLYPVFTTNNRLDSKFLQYELNFGKEFRKYSVLQKQGGSRTYMYFNKLRDLKLTITTSLKEQECIRNLICSIDHLITLHQSKLEKLQKIKKSMLESMFV